MEPRDQDDAAALCVGECSMCDGDEGSFGGSRGRGGELGAGRGLSKSETLKALIVVTLDTRSRRVFRG